ncbi:transglutaminase-like domain-containing protein [Pseudorhodoferax soli]|uniref:Transglutaminase-like putative cysteine protease n=1 Tax=Pseudorhodoferax soli TaxID=545864 RepID=A0A368XSI8_9BURK|nr:transglutaminase domain-containing protein [Pseudorhodoferax soli]RCW70459.1 transglutaminase-like putative cysteine protease [Pseudorhodoferax soli]
MPSSRRQFLAHGAALSAASAVPAIARAQAAPNASRRFDPQPQGWRRFDVTTRVDLTPLQGATKVWIPLPSLDTGWQRTLTHSFASNGVARVAEDGREGARMLAVEFAPGQAQPFVEVTSGVATQNRATDWSRRTGATESADTLRFYTRATALLPTDGIVRETALQATQGARTDVQKARAIYDWVVANTYREPKVRGCGEGDIATLLETGDLGGKCADLNALFVGLCRAVGVPARDVYGLRLAPSAFGYKELGGNPASLKGAQHCRAEVYLAGYGWVAMDPADVAKVMRLETPEWIKTVQNPVVAPVDKALFGGWEGNWMAYNTAHDLTLPGSRGEPLGFFMYPMAENAQGRFDPYAPDDFRYQISSRETTSDKA